MKPKLNLLKLSRISILQQLRIEEALLRADNQNWCLINEGSPPAIVMGISGKADLLIDQERLKLFPLPVIRRFSGGGTVVVDEETIFVTLICNSEAANVPCFPGQILNWNGDLYRRPLKGKEFRIQENDYALGSKKFGGNAQYICRNRWLHHSTLLWDYCPVKMAVLKMPPKVPAYRQGRDHKDFLCSLKPHFGCKEMFYRDFLEGLSEHFFIEESELVKVEEYLARPHRKATMVIGEAFNSPLHPN